MPRLESPRYQISLLLHLEGIRGPLDLLLDLARAQKVDLAKISILSLVEQFLAVIEGARRVRLELAADWLVMAAWLTWLKSRLLLPDGSEAAEEERAGGGHPGRPFARPVHHPCRRRLAVSPATTRPGGIRPGGGAPEDHTEIDRSRLALDLGSLVRAYLLGVRRGAGTGRYQPRPLNLWSVKDALQRLAALLGSVPDWTSLDHFLPETLGGPLERRAALASTLLASLELARGGGVRLRQEFDFGPILVRRGSPGVEEGA